MRMTHTNVIFGSYGFTLKQTNKAEMQNMLKKFAILDPLVSQIPIQSC